MTRPRRRAIRANHARTRIPGLFRPMQNAGRRRSGARTPLLDYS
jgi:hypothetical protein